MVDTVNAPATPAPAAPSPAPAAPSPAPAAPSPAPEPSPAPAPAEPLKNLFDDPAPTDPSKDPPADPPKPEGDKPLEYDIKLPEGLKLDDKQLDGIKSTLAEAKVAPEQAQGLVDKYLADLRAAQEAPHQLWHDTQKQWQDQVKADPEIGGQNLDRNLANIRKGAEALLGDQAKPFFEALNITGAGNNPAIVKALFKAFTPHAPAAPVSGSPQGQGQQRSAGQVLYPTQIGLGNGHINN